MAQLARALASLRVTAEHLVPDDVSSLLGCQPTKCWAKGDTWEPRWGNRTRTFGMWSLRASETEPADLDAQVAEILAQLPTDLSIWKELRSRYDVELFCGWFMEYGNEGLCVEPETMFALGQRGIVLDVDLYRGDSDKAPE